MAKKSTQRNYHILWSCEKLGIILETKVFQNLKLSKNDFNKRIALFKIIILDWKKNLKRWDNFGHWIFTLKVRFWHFLTNYSQKTATYLLCVLVFGQNYFYLAPTIFEISQPKWHYINGNCCEMGARQLFINKQVSR